MTQGGDWSGDDLAVDLSWPGGAAIDPKRPPPGQPPPEAAPPQRPVGPADALHRPPPPPYPPLRGSAPPPRAAGAAGPATARRGPDEVRPADAVVGHETLLEVVEHLNTLSRLVIETSKATSAELDALGARVEKSVSNLDALQLRVVRSLAGFDALRLRVQKELADRPPFTHDEVERIADAVTKRLLDHVRVEVEGDQR